ncbi:DUF3298 and DUF4163 domain-containing protein [Hymenobacter terricola]|uniref:DUF3298 and DUF4163 domain-containing protein n=1 Tax=Hymenobacter terricola TaxID=2819236 RepID=UPI001B30B6C7|nr:DUF3298 and DUF4163 domain-containing protein [Hymenobacter terricola]
MITLRFLSVAVLGTAFLASACQSKKDKGVSSDIPAAVVQPTAPDIATLATFSKRYTGTIGKSAIVLTIDKDSSGRLSGVYYYQRTRLPLTLNGRLRGHEAELDEQDQAGKITGRFAGKLSATGWAGIWTNTKTGAPLPLALHEDYTGAARLTFGSKEVKDCTIRFENRPADMDNCSVVSLRLPLVEEHDKINEDIRQLLMDDGSGTTENQNLDLQTWMKKRVYEGPVQADIDVSVVNNGYHLLSLQIDESEDSGGAHPNHSTRYINYDLRRNTQIRLRDLLAPGYEQRLLLLGRKLFYAQNADNDMLHDAEEFKMNENFLIQPTGLLFHFNPYEAAAYAGGDPTVFITYKQMGTLLQQGNPAEAFIKGQL